MRYVFTFVVSVLAAVVFAVPAQAAPCWEQVIEDWFDNERVDRTYQIHCYRDALANLPEDMRDYSSAPDDIARAMRQAIARQNDSTPTTQGDGGDSQAGGAGGGGGGGKGDSGGTKPRSPVGTTEPTVEPPGSGEASDPGIFPKTLEEIGPESASSFPLPLAILGGVALFLIAVGGMGIIARRLRPPHSPLPRR